MNEFLSGSALFGVVLSLAAYEVGLFLKKKLKHPLANPLLIAVILTIAVLLSMAVAALSCLMPVKRAVAIDPALVLKGE